MKNVRWREVTYFQLIHVVKLRFIRFFRYNNYKNIGKHAPLFYFFSNTHCKYNLYNNLLPTIHSQYSLANVSECTFICPTWQYLNLIQKIATMQQLRFPFVMFVISEITSRRSERSFAVPSQRSPCILFASNKRVSKFPLKR